MGADARFSESLSGGIEAFRRQLSEPLELDNDGFIQERADESLCRIYLYWTPYLEWAVGGELRFEFYHGESGELTRSGFPKQMHTWSAPIWVRYFHPAGFFAGVTGNPLYQNVRRQKQSGLPDGEDTFFIVDAAIGYRLPQRLGAVSLESRNLFNTGFKYQDDSFRDFREAPALSRFIPERTIVGRLTVSF